MKTYLLQIKTYDYSDETDDEYIEIFNTFERAKSYGLEFLTHELESYCKDINKSIKQALKEYKIDYDFRITEEDIEYAENFKKKLEFEEEIEELLIYEPTHKEFILDYTGEITNICIRYLFNQKETKWRNCVYLKPNDLLPNAGTKFKIGDLVKIVKPNKRMEDCSYNEHPEYSDVYVVRYLPRRIEGQKYLRNTYALSEISDDNYAPGIYTWEFHEEQMAEYDEEIEENSPIDVLRKIIKKEIKVNRETWDNLKYGVISFKDEDKRKSNYYKKVLKLGD